MALVAKNTSEYTPAPAGTHPARCVQIIDLGTQHNHFFDKSQHKILVGWELPLTCNKNDDGNPFLMWQRYTMSLNDKSHLYKDVKAWRGLSDNEIVNGFKLTELIGMPCMLNISHEMVDKGGQTRVYANVAAVMKLPENFDIPDQHHKSIVFDIDKWDQAVFDTFSDNLKNTIMASAEYQARVESHQATEGEKTPATKPTTARQMHEAIKEDEIPF